MNFAVCLRRPRSPGWAQGPRSTSCPIEIGIPVSRPHRPPSMFRLCAHASVTPRSLGQGRGSGGSGGQGRAQPLPQRAGGGALSRRCSAPPRPAARLAPQAACIPAGHGVTEHVRGRTFSRPSACLCIDSQSRTRHQCLSGGSPTTHLTARRPGGHVEGGACGPALLISFFTSKTKINFSFFFPVLPERTSVMSLIFSPLEVKKGCKKGVDRVTLVVL